MDISETKLQQQCFIWHWNEYPEQRGLLCYNLNNSKNKIDGARNKSLGLIAGRSDMVFYYNSIAYMIEFKVKKSGIQSKKQLIWQELITKNGFSYEIINDFEDFKAKIVKIITF